MAAISGSAVSAQEFYMIVGTYTKTDSKGIYVYKFDSQTGKATFVSTMDGIKNPSYVTIHNDHVYAVSETNGDDPGSVSAYRFNRENGKLHFLNNLATGGDDPCYVQVDASGKFVAVANYSGGNVSLFSTKEDGSLDEDKELIQHHGSSINKDRQDAPHVHEAVFSPDQKYLLTPDLGIDRVVIYHFDKNAKKVLLKAGEIVCEPGSGPRHIAFHPGKPFAYLIHELNAKVAVYEYHGDQYQEIQQIKTWPEGFEGDKDGAEVAVSADGKFLYTSQRGDQNTIAVFSIDEKNGKLTHKDFTSVEGKGPRFFMIDPTGKFLLVANQFSDNIVIFKRDAQSGLLTKQDEIKIPIPVSIAMTPVR